MEQDESKALVWYEIAAKKGSIEAHKYLSSFHGNYLNIDESVRHCIVAARAGDKESRISISGYILYFAGVPIV